MYYCKTVIGIDISSNLLKILKEKVKNKGFSNVICIHGNLIDIPLMSDSIDAVLYIAALHNIKDRNNRIKSLKEVKRILENDGVALISVWSRWQDRYRRHFLKQLFSKNNREFGDIDIYWKQNNLNVPRFYHLYSKREFIKDLKQSGLNIEKIMGKRYHSKLSADNYFAIVRKG